MLTTKICQGNHLCTKTLKGRKDRKHLFDLKSLEKIYLRVVSDPMSIPIYVNEIQVVSIPYNIPIRHKVILKKK
jgi:hypothetical protein